MQPFEVRGKVGYTAFSSSEWANAEDSGGAHHRAATAARLISCDALQNWWYSLSQKQRKVTVLTAVTVAAAAMLLLIVTSAAQANRSPTGSQPDSLPPIPMPPHPPGKPPPRKAMSLPPPPPPPSPPPPRPPSPQTIKVDDALCSWSSFYLPSDAVHPTQYDLYLAVRNADWQQQLDALPLGEDSGDLVLGSVAIHVHVQRASPCVVLHAYGMNITDVSFTTSGRAVQGGAVRGRDLVLFTWILWLKRARYPPSFNWRQSSLGQLESCLLLRRLGAAEQQHVPAGCAAL